MSRHPVPAAQVLTVGAAVFRMPFHHHVPPSHRHVPPSRPATTSRHHVPPPRPAMPKGAAAARQRSARSPHIRKQLRARQCRARMLCSPPPRRGRSRFRVKHMQHARAPSRVPCSICRLHDGADIPPEGARARLPLVTVLVSRHKGGCIVDAVSSSSNRRV
jgi:hypothetical protein